MSVLAGINHWALPGVGAQESAAMAARAGFEALELNLDESGDVTLDTNEEAAAKVRMAVEGEGVRIGGLSTGLYWKYSPTADEQDIRRKAVDIAKHQLRTAAALGAEAVLIVPGSVGAGMGGPLVQYDVAYERATQFLSEITPIAEETGVYIGIENVWNKFLLSPLEMKQYINAPGSDRVGVYFDVGNILLYGYPEQWVRILGPSIKRVHLKDFRRSVGTLAGFVDIGTGDVDWEAVGEALRQVGYSGTLTAEVFPSDEERADLQAYVNKIGSQVLDVMKRMGYRS